MPEYSLILFALSCWINASFLTILCGWCGDLSLLSLQVKGAYCPNRMSFVKPTRNSNSMLTGSHRQSHTINPDKQLHVASQGIHKTHTLSGPALKLNSHFAAILAARDVCGMNKDQARLTKTLILTTVDQLPMPGYLKSF